MNNPSPAEQSVVVHDPDGREEQDELTERLAPPRRAELRSLASLLTPAGAGCAAFCFFLPWLHVSCIRDVRLTGLELADMDWKHWLVLGGEAAILLLWLAGRAGWLRKPRRCLVAAALAPLGLLAYGLVRLLARAKDVDVRFEAGAIGTVAGLVLALAGAWAAAPRRRRRPPAPVRDIPSKRE